MKTVTLAHLIVGVLLFSAPVAWGADEVPLKPSPPTMVFYHHSVGTCYLENGLAEVAKRHGYNLAPVDFKPTSNCACDLQDWFASNPSSMTGNVLVKSCFPCSNLWSDDEVSRSRACYRQLRAQAAQHGANLYIISPTPYDRAEMEQNGWRIDARRGADLMDSLETGHAVDPFLNVNRVLRDVGGGLPYLAETYASRPGDSHPNDAGCRAVVKAIDSWLPYVAGKTPK